MVVQDSLSVYLKDPHPMNEDLMMITDKAEAQPAFPSAPGESSPWPWEPQGQIAKVLVISLKKELKRQQHFT